MINLALMTLSASSLERRIIVLQDGRKLSRSTRLISGSFVALVLILACSTRPGTEISPRTTVAAPVAREPTMDQLRAAVLARTGGTLESGQQYWVLFNVDWSVQEFDVGTEDAVQIPDSVKARYGAEFVRRNPGPMYSLVESMLNKFPELKTAVSPEYPFAGVVAMEVGSDTATVNWGHLAN